mmetsp:Transcript_22554/g.40703  ORF Transcript_22554/g.40703 Transcript_22554/m.40703 type:complete len:658 (-) Transcript_22554:513-2486(-)
MWPIMISFIALLCLSCHSCYGIGIGSRKSLSQDAPGSSLYSSRPIMNDVETVPIFPAQQPLHSFFAEPTDDGDQENLQFSILSWNILLPNSEDNWWNHKMYASWVPSEKREWPHRQALIRERLLRSGADIICIQEADERSFQDDFGFLKQAGYDCCLHNKFRFRCATFFKAHLFALDQEAHKDRALITALRPIQGSKHRMVHVVNCHLSGGAAPDRRLRQVHDALDQLRKWKAKAATTLQKQTNAKRPSPRNIQKAQDDLQLQENAAVIVCGDFNSDGDTAVRRLLVEGSIDTEWREPQYPNVALTSKERSTSYRFVDAAEVAYSANVCDGDYGEKPEFGSRPATYVVPNLASLLLLSIQGEDPILRTQFGHQVARGLADALGLRSFCQEELNRAFESIDLDGNNVIDEDEIQELLNSVYMATHRRYPTEEERGEFLSGFQTSTTTIGQLGLSHEQLTEKLIALQQELEGGIEGAELMEIRTEADAQRMISRFSPILLDALNFVFDEFSSDGGNSLTKEEVERFLIQTNGKLGRGGTSSHTSAVLQRKTDASKPAVLTRQEWYGVFARELGEGKWWQVVHDLEVCGAKLRSKVEREGRHYQGWLDYVYFDSQRLTCKGVQEALTATELSRIYDDGDALPNEWHPSDHLPVAAVFSLE